MLRRIFRHQKYLPYCFEALGYLALCKWLIVCRPFQRYVKNYGVAHCETLQEALPLAKETILAIRLALRVVPVYLPWKSKCLDQAMAAQRMLARRGIQNTLYFGMVKDSHNALLAHAWLRAGQWWVVGYQPTIPYRIVGTYAWLI